mmetsp:Transcript_105156/g.272328  ORF Transcript_105156/g.272328 Transcript_105156/m.272328 type:complete len:531 (-) Transcript_105156:1882-3474(-)
MPTPSLVPMAGGDGKSRAGARPRRCGAGAAKPPPNCRVVLPEEAAEGTGEAWGSVAPLAMVAVGSKLWGAATAADWLPLDRATAAAALLVREGSGMREGRCSGATSLAKGASLLPSPAPQLPLPPTSSATEATAVADAAIAASPRTCCTCAVAARTRSAVEAEPGTASAGEEMACACVLATSASRSVNRSKREPLPDIPPGEKVLPEKPLGDWLDWSCSRGITSPSKLAKRARVLWATRSPRMSNLSSKLPTRARISSCSPCNSSNHAPSANVSTCSFTAHSRERNSSISTVDSFRSSCGCACTCAAAAAAAAAACSHCHSLASTLCASNAKPSSTFRTRSASAVCSPRRSPASAAARSPRPDKQPSTESRRQRTASASVSAAAKRSWRTAMPCSARAESDRNSPVAFPTSCSNWLCKPSKSLFETSITAATFTSSTPSFPPVSTLPVAQPAAAAVTAAAAAEDEARAAAASPFATSAAAVAASASAEVAARSSESSPLKALVLSSKQVVNSSSRPNTSRLNSSILTSTA